MNRLSSQQDAANHQEACCESRDRKEIFDLNIMACFCGTLARNLVRTVAPPPVDLTSNRKEQDTLHSNPGSTVFI